MRPGHAVNARSYVGAVGFRHADRVDGWDYFSLRPISRAFAPMPRNTSGSFVSVLLIGLLFFLFGFVTWLNATLIPYLQLACELTSGQAYLVTLAFYISYFVMALPSSAVLERTGFKGGMSVGLAVMAVGALVFLPAAWYRQYPMFLAGLFIIGSGLALLQTATNPYVTLVGPIESAASRISVMGICNKLAGVFAPLVLGAMVLADADALELLLPTLEGAALAETLDALAARAIPPYAFMAGALLLLAVLVRLSPLPEVDASEEVDRTAQSGAASVFGHPNLVFGVIALFLYVGAEVVAVDTIGPYANGLGIPLGEAKYYGSYTLMGMVLGYIMGIATIPRFLRQSTALALSALAGIVLVTGAVLVDPDEVAKLPFLDLEGLRAVRLSVPVSALFLALLGIANALMWPAIWPLAIADTGRHTKTASALLIMAIAGGAVLPLVYNAMAQVWGGQAGYWILLPCYLFIGWYAIRGHRRSRWT